LGYKAEQKKARNKDPIQMRTIGQDKKVKKRDTADDVQPVKADAQPLPKH
jgi:hypothetical protein